NPGDARFIGSPIDLVVFDGLGTGDVRRIVFVEIKTGASTLSTRERMVRDAVTARRIEWQEIRVNFQESEVLENEHVVSVVTPLGPEEKARRARARLYQKYVRRAK
ncbi:MAG: Holliday junction resolvase-like protein, partial [Bacteroidota bacterium]